MFSLSLSLSYFVHRIAYPPAQLKEDPGTRESVRMYVCVTIARHIHLVNKRSSPTPFR